MPADRVRLGVLKALHRPHVGHRHKLVGAASGLLDLAGLPRRLFLYRPLVGFSPHAREVVVVGRSPLAPGEGAGPPAPCVGGFRRVGVPHMPPVSFQKRPLAAGKAQEALEGAVGPLGFVLQSIPSSLFSVSIPESYLFQKKYVAPETPTTVPFSHHKTHT